MNREDIIRMAQEAGVSPVGDDQIKFAGPMWLCLERFANLVVAEEREECAKLCDEMPLRSFPSRASDCAAAIRARGEK